MTDLPINELRMTNFECRVVTGEHPGEIRTNGEFRVSNVECSYESSARFENESRLRSD